ncbi:MAG: hypothetical protein H6581_10020 [Bacteroidia bacterium]|nr:hypothetical protein [Bacteroidia bacterium]
MNGYRVSLPRVERLMRKAGVKSKHRRKYVLTTDSQHNFRRSPNLLQRQFQPGQISRAWVSDITFIRTDQGGCFLICNHRSGRSKSDWMVYEQSDDSSGHCGCCIQNGNE